MYIMDCFDTEIFLQSKFLREHFTLTLSPRADFCHGRSHASETHLEQTSEPLHLPDLDAQGFYIHKHTEKQSIHTKEKGLSNSTYLGFTEKKILKYVNCALKFLILIKVA